MDQPPTAFHKGKSRCKVCQAEVASRARLKRLERIRNSAFEVDREHVAILPIGPWRAWLEERKAELRADYVPSPTTALAEFLGTEERTVFGWLHDRKGVQLDVLDRALCHAQMPWLLRELYPELFEECEACGCVGRHSESCALASAEQGRAA